MTTRCFDSAAEFLRIEVLVTFQADQGDQLLRARPRFPPRNAAPLEPVQDVPSTVCQGKSARNPETRARDQDWGPSPAGRSPSPAPVDGATKPRRWGAMSTCRSPRGRGRRRAWSGRREREVGEGEIGALVGAVEADSRPPRSRRCRRCAMKFPSGGGPRSSDAGAFSRRVSSGGRAGLGVAEVEHGLDRLEVRPGAGLAGKVLRLEEVGVERLDRRTGWTSDQTFKVWCAGWPAPWRGRR